MVDFLFVWVPPDKPLPFAGTVLLGIVGDFPCFEL
jgi:hypothetical protein